MRWFRRRRRAAPREDTIETLVACEWGRLAGPGTWWTSAERRVMVDETIRSVRADSSTDAPDRDLDGPVAEAIRSIAVAPGRIAGTDVARWELEGLDSFAYVELLAVVARTVALDTLTHALGHPLPEPPPIVQTPPTRRRPGGAAITTGWAPTVGPAELANALSAVPDEQAALDDLLAALRRPREGASRLQVDLALARAAVLDDCLDHGLERIESLRCRLSSGGTALDDRPIITGCGDTGVAHGAAVIAFVDAAVLRDDDELPIATRRLLAAVDRPGVERIALAVAEATLTDRLRCGVGVPLVDDDTVIDLRDDQTIGTAPVLIG